MYLGVEEVGMGDSGIYGIAPGGETDPAPALFLYFFRYTEFVLELQVVKGFLPLVVLDDIAVEFLILGEQFLDFLYGGLNISRQVISLK